MYATFVMIKPNRDGATQQTRQQLLMNGVTLISNDQSDRDLWYFDLEIDRHTPTCHELYLYQV